MASIFQMTHWCVPNFFLKLLPHQPRVHRHHHLRQVPPALIIQRRQSLAKSLKQQMNRVVFTTHFLGIGRWRVLTPSLSHGELSAVSLASCSLSSSCTSFVHDRFSTHYMLYTLTSFSLHSSYLYCYILLVHQDFFVIVLVLVTAIKISFIFFAGIRDQRDYLSDSWARVRASFGPEHHMIRHFSK